MILPEPSFLETFSCPAFFMIVCLHGSFLTSLTISIWAYFSSPKSRQASPKCPVRGHLLFMLSLGIRIPSYTFHYFLNANESQVCILNCSLSFSFTLPAPHWGTYLCTIMLLQQSWAPLHPIPHRGGLTFYPATWLVWLFQWPQFLCLTLHSYLYILLFFCLLSSNQVLNPKNFHYRMSLNSTPSFQSYSFQLSAILINTY